MVSKNNIQLKDRYATKQVPHYGIRKLSVGVASVLLSTTLYMGVTAHADTIAETNPQPTVDQPASTATGNATDNVQLKSTDDQSASTTTNSISQKNDGSAKAVQTVSPEQSADATDAQPTSDQLESAAANSNAPENNESAVSASTVLPKQPANADTPSTATMSGVQPFVNLAVESDNNDLTPTHETIDSKWTLHYVNQADHKQELKDPTVITMQYTRTDTPQSDGTTQYGDWSYVPGSFKQTGTQITVKDSNNPVKQDNVDKNGENFDVFTITAMYPTISGYTMHNNINGTRLHDDLINDNRQADMMSKDFYAEYDVAKERSVTVKFVDDQSFDPDSSDGKTQVGQAVTLTGRDGDTVKVNVTVPDKYQLSNGQQLPTTYTFTAGSGDVTIHLVHKVVQREATIDFQLGLTTFVDFGDNSYEPAVLTQAQWKQLEEEAKDGDGPVSPGDVIPFTEVGTLTGHVGYDLVDEEAVSFGDDWTSLNLGSRTYQLPNGTDMVNGILIDSDDTMGKKLKEYYLNEYRNWDSNKHVDPDYANRPWHGYLSVNATNNTQTPGTDYIIRSGLQAGLAGNEPNALAKATGDRAATAVEMANKTIDVSWLQDNLDFGARDFSEQDGQLKAKSGWRAFGVYIPYVEKTATRTINVTTPDGKTTAVKQTATLAKQIDFEKDAHPAWTTGEWANYDVPTIPGYTASQSNVAKETVTGTTEDQTINITYTANDQSTQVVFVDDDNEGKTVDHKSIHGKTGETVNLSLTIPDKYQLADGQQLPTTYTFVAGGGDVTIHLAHKVVQREATVDVQIGFMTLVDLDDEEEPGIVVTQNQWRQLDDEIKKHALVNDLEKVDPTVGVVSTLTGHVNYDLVDNKVVSFADDWTSLNLGGQTYQMPDGTDVVNGIIVGTDLSWGEKLKEHFLKYYPDDPDYVNRAWYGYLSVNKSNIDPDYAGFRLVGNESNALAKAIDDRAATAVEMTNKPIDLSSLQDVMGGGLSDFNEQDGQLRAKAIVPVEGMYIPYVEKTVTRTINVTTPDGKTTSVKQITTLAKQVTAQENAHPEWTTSEWSSYDAPTIPGYTASQSNVAKEAVTGTTNDQTVNVTYTPDAQKLSVTFIDDTTGQVLKSVTKTGVTNAAAGYNTQSDIQSYEGQHYVLVSDSSNGANLVFDNNDSTDQAYEVHLKHGTHQIDEHHTITQTVHYTATDHASVPDDHTALVQFDRDGYHDEVTGVDHWNAWKQGSTQTFSEVPTPKKAGYTPDKSSVPATVVHPSDHNQTIDVTYTPDTQKVIVTFIDDTDNGKTLKTVTKTGPTNSSVGYTTGDDINVYKGQHYVLVSDQTHGQSITFDTDTKVDQHYEVHLKHGTHQINDQRTITETVHYKMTDGTTAPADHTAKVEFSRDGFNDEVTGDDHWNAWAPSATQQFDAVQSPAVKGYTPDVDQIPVVTHQTYRNLMLLSSMIQLVQL